MKNIQQSPQEYDIISLFDDDPVDANNTAIV